MSEEINGVATENANNSHDVSTESTEVNSPSEESSEHTSRRKQKEEERRSELEALQNEVKSLREAITPFKEESSLNSALEKYKIAESDFNKDQFEVEKKALLEDGVSLERATELAVKLTTSTTKIQEAEERNVGRKNASLPPESTQAHEQVVFTEDQLYSLPQAKFKEVHQKVLSGEYKLV